jgi:hypothetical protein
MRKLENRPSPEKVAQAERPRADAADRNPDAEHTSAAS